MFVGITGSCNETQKAYSDALAQGQGYCDGKAIIPIAAAQYQRQYPDMEMVKAEGDRPYSWASFSSLTPAQAVVVVSGAMMAQPHE